MQCLNGTFSKQNNLPISMVTSPQMCPCFRETCILMHTYHSVLLFCLAWILALLHKWENKASFSFWKTQSKLHQNITSWCHAISVCSMHYGPLTRYVNCVLRMRRDCRERFPRHQLQWKTQVSDPGMHHGTCVTHVPWCMPGSLFYGGGENVPGIPGACTTRNFTYLARGPYKQPARDIFLS